MSLVDSHRKKLMVLGASEPQARLIKAAKELGYYTIVASIEGNYPGFEVADKIDYTDITDKESVLKAAKRHNIDGIASCSFDLPVEALGYVNDQLHLCGLSLQAAEMAANKFLMKQAFEKYGVKSARYRQVKTKTELDSAMKELTFPLIIKAVDLASSVGIYKAENKQEAYFGFEEAMKLTGKDYCIVEEFIVGEEFGAQAFVYENDVKFVIIHGDSTYVSHTAMPIGHYVPYHMDKVMEEKSVAVVKAAIKAIGLNNCAVNVDLIRKGDDVYMIELTGRAGATCLPELVSVYYGIDYYKAIAMMACGDDPMAELNKRHEPYTANASMLLMSHKSGIVKEIKNDNNNEAYIHELSLDVKVGDQVQRYESSKNKIGQVVVKGETYEQCQDYLEHVLNNLEIDIEEQ